MSKVAQVLEQRRLELALGADTTSSRQLGLRLGCRETERLDVLAEKLHENPHSLARKLLTAALSEAWSALKEMTDPEAFERWVRGEGE